MEIDRNKRERTQFRGSSSTNSMTYYCGAKFDTIPTSSILPQPPNRWMSQSKSTPSSPIPATSVSNNYASSAKVYSDGKNAGPGPVFKSASLPISGNGNNGFIEGKFEHKDNFKQKSIYVAEKNDKKNRPSNKKNGDNAYSSKNDSLINGEALMKMMQSYKPEDGKTSIHQQQEPMKQIMKSPAESSIKPIMLSALEASLKQQLNIIADSQHQLNASPKPCHFYESNQEQYKDISEHLKSLLKVCN